MCERSGLGQDGVTGEGPVRSECCTERETYAVICFEIVNLLPEDKHPEVFAEELDNVQRIGEAWSIAGEAIRC